MMAKIVVARERDDEEKRLGHQRDDEEKRPSA